MVKANKVDTPKNNTPRYLRDGARYLGIFGAFFAILFGFWNCFGLIVLNYYCLVSGILQILLGILVMVTERPHCCRSHGDKQEFVQTGPYWNRTAEYCIGAILAVVILPGLASILGCSLIFVTGILYGIISIYEKRTMKQAAAANPSDNMEEI